MAKEKKDKKFIELAEKRVTSAILQIRLIGNLSNKNNYDYDSTQVKKIFEAIENELKLSKSKFQAGLKKKETRVFSLNGGE